MKFIKSYLQVLAIMLGIVVVIFWLKNDAHADNSSNYLDKYNFLDNNTIREDNTIRDNMLRQERQRFYMENFDNPHIDSYRRHHLERQNLRDLEDF